MEPSGQFFVDRLDKVKVESCGCAVLTPPWIHPRRNLESHVLLLGVKGTVPLHVDSFDIDLVPQRLVLLRSAVPHWGRSSISAPARYYWVHFRAPLRAVRSPDYGGSFPVEGAVIPQSVDVGDDPSFRYLFLEMLKVSETRAYTGWKVRIRLLELLMRLTERLNVFDRTEVPTSVRSGLILRIQTRITEELVNQNLSVKSLAYEQGVNADYLGRLFRSVVGIPLGEYLSQRRIELSFALLEETRKSIVEVASACGFGSDRQFQRVFKHQVGVSPSDYRREALRVHITEK